MGESIIEKLREFVNDGNDGTFGTVAMHGACTIGGRVSELLAEIDAAIQRAETAEHTARSLQADIDEAYRHLDGK